LIAVAIFVYGVYRHVRLWRAGRPENRFDNIPQRVKLVAKHALGQARTLSQAYPGIMHAIMFWGFLALLLGTVLASIVYDVTQPWCAPWSAVGWAVVQGMLAAVMVEGALRVTHLGFWLGHAALSLFFVAVIPYSYFVHMLTTPLNIFFSKLTPRGEIRKIENIEEAESLGVST